MMRRKKPTRKHVGTQLSAGTSEADAILIECNEDMDSDGMHDDEPRVRKAVALPSLGSYTPRPYVFKFDHKGNAIV